MPWNPQKNGFTFWMLAYTDSSKNSFKYYGAIWSDTLNRGAVVFGRRGNVRGDGRAYTLTTASKVFHTRQGLLEQLGKKRSKGYIDVAYGEGGAWSLQDGTWFPSLGGMIQRSALSAAGQPSPKPKRPKASLAENRGVLNWYRLD